MTIDLEEAIKELLENDQNYTILNSKHLSRTSFSIHKVPSDGNCLWSALAVAEFLTDSSDRVTPAVFEALHRRAVALRREICRELVDDDLHFKEEYQPFWASGEEYSGDAKTYNEYLDLLWDGRVFGGALELHVASLAMEREIIVVDVPSTVQEDFLINVSSRGTGLHIKKPLVLVRRNYHYDALIPR